MRLSYDPAIQPHQLSSLMTEDGWIGLAVEAFFAQSYIPGWLKPDEITALFLLSKHVPQHAAVCCEIGCWLGKSSVILGTALKAKEAARLFCIDPFDLEKDDAWNRKMKQEQLGDANLSRKDVFNQFVRQNQLADIISPIEAYSHDFVAVFKHKIDLLFIDGDHRYEGVLRDFTMWSPLIKPGGFIAFHDYSHAPGEPPGPAQVVDEFIRDSDAWTDQQLFGSLYVATKV